MKLEIVRGHDKLVQDFVADRSPIERPLFLDGDRGFAVIRENGDMVAGVVFSDWKPALSSVEISAVAISSHALSPQIVSALGAYAFGQLSANRVWARTAVSNHRARKLLRHIGFTLEGAHADYYGVGRPAETYRMLKREWIPRYGNVLKAAA